MFTIEELITIKNSLIYRLKILEKEIEIYKDIDLTSNIEKIKELIEKVKNIKKEGIENDITNGI